MRSCSRAAKLGLLISVVGCSATKSERHRAVKAMRDAYYAGRSDEALGTALMQFGTGGDATARQVVGAILQERGDLDVSRTMLMKAYAEHHVLGDHGEQARDAQLLAGIAMRRGNLAEALDSAELADREAAATSDLRLQGSTALAYGKILGEIGDYSAARTTLWKAQQQLASFPTDRAWAYLELGIFVGAAGEQKDSAALLETALDLATRNRVATVITAAHLNLAYVRRKLGQLAEAERNLGALSSEDRKQTTALFVAGVIAADRGHRNDASRLLASAAANPPTDDYAAEIAFERGRIAENAGDVREAEARYREAVRFVENVRGDTSSLELRPWVLSRRREPFTALLAILARQGRHLEALETAEQLHARVWLDALVERATSGERRAWLASTDRITAAAATPATPRLLALLGDRETLVFADTGSDVWRFQITGGKIAHLDRLDRETMAHLETWQRTPDDADAARRLGEALIPDSLAASERPLYVVTNGRLDPVAFAGLRRKGHFLVEDRPIVRLPGIAVLRCRNAGERTRHVVFIGDSRGDLPAARTETVELAHSLGGESFVGDTATVDTLRRSHDATLLHLAVHADAGSSGHHLALAVGTITSRDIIEMELAPRVAVLAGCATGASRDAEGWDALSSAFLFAGSRSVVATLTAVVDRDATELLTRFYAHDGEHHPAIAVAAAQRELLATYPPSTWATFIVLGGADANDCSP